MITSLFLRSSNYQNFKRVLNRTFDFTTQVQKILSHIDEKNQPTMVDIQEKVPSVRTAHAQSIIVIPATALRSVEKNPSLDERKGGGAEFIEIKGAKGPVFATAIVSGTLAAKNTSNLIPFCHHLQLESCKFKIKLVEETLMSNEAKIFIECFVKTTGKTGVEMEALTGCSVAALCVYDMLKSFSHEIVVQETKLLKKSGGKSDFMSAS